MAKKPEPLGPAIGKKLLPREARFVAEYLKDFEPAAAYVRAGYHATKNAGKNARELMKRPQVAEAIAAHNAKHIELAGIDLNAALQEAWAVSMADHRELVELHLSNCRHCWGRGHRYQWNEAEVDAATRDFEQGITKKAPDFTGGMGYSPHTEPNPECPVCAGEGRARVILKDTRHFSPQAKALYAGVKVTKEGIQVLTHSKQGFADMVWRHLGLYLKDNEQKKTELSDQLRQLVGELHSQQAGRAPLALVRNNTKKVA